MFRKNNSPEQTLAEAKAHAIRTLANAAQLLDLLGSDQAVEEALSDASRDLP